METPPQIPTPPRISSAPPPLPSPPPYQNRGKQLALASVLAPFAAVAVNVASKSTLQGNQVAMMIVGCTCILLILFGFGAGIGALIGIRRYGRVGVMVRAILGVCINGIIIGLILIAIPGFVAAANRAKQKQTGQVSPRETQHSERGQTQSPRVVEQESLSNARRRFSTLLLRKENELLPAPEPPAELFELIKYQSPVGRLSAYVSPSPNDGQKHPVVIWLVGGFGNSISELAWDEFYITPENDQSGSAFRKAGLLMMYPSLRGGNDNPGFKEGLYGEVEDVLAARDYLETLDYIDPQRIYLAGHSTGGTLALLVAESSDKFRAVFAFGPVESVAGYGAAHLPFDVKDKREAELRAPIRYLRFIRTPTFVMEGARGNSLSLRRLSDANQNELVGFHTLKGHDHFSLLAPVTKLLAAKIVEDTGVDCNITILDEEFPGRNTKVTE